MYKIPVYQIPGYKNYYCDEDGNIWSFKPSGWKILKPYTESNGYNVVRLSKDGIVSKYCIHILMLITFYGERPIGYKLHITYYNLNAMEIFCKWIEKVNLSLRRF